MMASRFLACCICTLVSLSLTFRVCRTKRLLAESASETTSPRDSSVGSPRPTNFETELSDALREVELSALHKSESGVDAFKVPMDKLTNIVGNIVSSVGAHIPGLDDKFLTGVTRTVGRMSRARTQAEVGSELFAADGPMPSLWDQLQQLLFNLQMLSSPSSKNSKHKEHSQKQIRRKVPVSRGNASSAVGVGIQNQASSSILVGGLPPEAPGRSLYTNNSALLRGIEVKFRDSVYRFSGTLGQGRSGCVVKACRAPTQQNSTPPPDLDSLAIDPPECVAVKLSYEASLDREKRILEHLQGSSVSHARMIHSQHVKCEGFTAGMRHVSRFLKDCFIMEFIDGGTLQAAMQDRPPVPMEDWMRILCSLAYNVDELTAHDVYNWDQRPWNVIISGTAVYFIDFDYAQVVDPERGLSWERSSTAWQALVQSSGGFLDYLASKSLPDKWQDFQDSLRGALQNGRLVLFNRLSTTRMSPMTASSSWLTYEQFHDVHSAMHELSELGLNCG